MPESSVKVLSGATLTLGGGTIGAGALVETASGGTVDRERQRSPIPARCIASGTGELGGDRRAAPWSAAARSWSATASSTCSPAAPPTSTSCRTAAGGPRNRRHQRAIQAPSAARSPDLAAPIIPTTSSSSTSSMSCHRRTRSLELCLAPAARGTLFVSSGGAVVAQHQPDRHLLGGELQHQGRHRRHRGDHRPGGAQWRQCRARSDPSRGTASICRTSPSARRRRSPIRENAAGTGGTLTVNDGRHAAAIALLGNYMAGSFVTAADGHGGTLVTEASQAAQPLLARPHPT